MKSKEYNISFYKKAGSLNEIFYIAESSAPENGDIANHLTLSDKYLTEDQIEELNKVLNGIRVQEDWGEVMGSQLEIFPQENTVQVGYTNRRIPLSDFKQLLEEWLLFIS